MKPNMWKFTQVSQEENKSTETTVFLSPDISWYDIMPHFAMFLEGAGYTGVYEILEKIGAFNPPTKHFDEQYCDTF
jgi:hypothetical protein